MSLEDKDCKKEECGSCPIHGKCSKENKIQKVSMHPSSYAKHIIGVVSGKGGVGKSFVSSYLAVLLAKQGYKVGILDADITGPSIPFSFGMKYKALGNEEGLICPGVSKKYQIRVISSNMLLENDTDPIIYRGPLIGDMVIQFYNNVYWSNLDYLLIDMPPGTGDVALSIFQQIPIDGIISVTTSQQLVSMVVEKSVKMAELMKIKLLGLVSNMAYVKCPNCDEKIYLYGNDHLQELASKYNIKSTSLIPLDKDIASFVDNGKIEELNVNYLDELVNNIIEELK